MLQEPSRTPLAPDRSPNTVTAKREDSIMNSKRNFTNNSWESFNWLLAALALALIVPARAGTQPAAIPFSDIGARATANYQGDALGVTARADGARLRCGFQKLEGHATPEGLWLESTKPGAAGRFRLVAVTVGRGGSRARQSSLTETASSGRSGMSVATVPQGDQAPSGAPCTHGAASFFEMPLLTELETTLSDVPFYRHAAPNGAIPCPSQGTQTLARTGTVSVDDKLVRFTRPGLTEEYSVSVDGVRQDFIIESPPLNPSPSALNPQPSTLNHSAGDLRVELALSGARAEATASGARLTLEGSGRALAYSRLRVEDATGRELTARLKVLSADRLAVSVADANATYPVRIDPTFSDADWVSLSSLPGTDQTVWAIVVDGSGNVYVGGQFTAIGTVPANRIAKWDGSVWSALGSGMSDVVYALAVSGTNLYAGGYFSTAGGVPANRIAKWDGSGWSALSSGMSSPTDYEVCALAVSGTNLYAGGYFTTAGGVAATNIAKWNGSAWSALGSGIGGSYYATVLALAVSGTDLYAGGDFTTAGGVSANYIAKWDGSAWSALGSGIGAVHALAVSGTDLYAASGNNIAKWNGSTWSPLGSGMSGGNFGVRALAVNGTTLYAAGDFTTAGGVTANCVARWNGSAWSALGSGIGGSDPPGFGINALAVSGTNLYAGGYFSSAGGVTAYNLAKWNGGAWSAWGSQVNTYVNGGINALAVSGNNLYAGGHFGTAGGVTASKIAKWNGSAWSALGSGINTYFVYGLAVSGNNLYAGGNFTPAGGVAATNIFSNIAKWNGSAWSALGSGMDNTVYALAVSGTDLYAGGWFTNAGGVKANKVAKWNGSVWSALGSGIDGAVYALAVSGTNLYAGGYFSTAGGVPAINIAKWNGSAWSALGSGLGYAYPYYAYVYALAVDGRGHLFAGGSFTNAGGMPASYIAEWDGGAWSALGSGMNDQVSALAVSSTGLFAGGSFTNAGGVPANYIARWDGGAWWALGSGMSSQVSTLAADEMGHLFVGGSFYRAGINASFYIAQANLGNAPTNAPPVILASPASRTVPLWGTANFQAEVFGLAPLVYQWVFNGTNAIAGATSARLSLTNVQFTQTGTYSVTVSNVYGAVTSAPAVLTVAPLIVASPASLAVVSGARADFQVEATGWPPSVYQWFFNGTNAIAGATSAALTLANAQLTQAGAYSVTLSNLYGTVTSVSAWLQVFPRGIVVTNSEIALRTVMSPGGTVTFACDGTITLASTITNAIDTTLDGSGRQVTISGNGAVRVFYVNTNVSFKVVNVTIADGTSLGGSAILNLGGTVNLSGVTFRSNTATLNVFNDGLSPKASGGAIFNRGGTVNASNCSFARNTAHRDGSSWKPLDTLVYGGAIRNEAGLVALRSCAFVGNQAVGGAATATDPGDTARGGAIHNSGTATLDLCTLTDNSANGGSSALSNAGFSGGEGSGGAVFNEGTLTTDRTTLCGNTAAGGDGALGWPMPSAFTVGQGGDALGAAICNVGSLWATRSTLASNVVTGGNGGNGGVQLIIDSSIKGGSGGNGGSGLGGALRNSGVASLVNCTIASNTGSGGPGGWGQINLLPWPLVGFAGPGGDGGDGGSGFGGVDGTCNLINCTVAWNQGNAGAAGTAGAGNPNGTSGTSGSGWGGTTCGLLVNTLIVSNTPAGGDTFTDPKLGPLADNGGPTLTMALLPGSPAIDAGNTSLAPATDQRGFSRPAGRAADIGAFEYGSVMSPIAVSRFGATGLSIVAIGNAGQSCRLLSSADLLSWVPIATNQIGTNGTILFNLNYSPGSACRFYRLVMP
jgi:hypothetical protein